MRCALVAFRAAVLLVLIMTLTDSCGGAYDVDRARALIDSVRTGFVIAYEAGDVEALLAYYDEDYLDMSMGVDTRGKEQMKRAFEDSFAKSDRGLEIHPEEVLIQGKWAMERGTFTIRLTDRSTGAESLSHRRYLEILIRRDDGRWYIFRDLDNEIPGGSPVEGSRTPTRGSRP